MYNPKTTDTFSTKNIPKEILKNPPLSTVHDVPHLKRQNTFLKILVYLFGSIMLFTLGALAMSLLLNSKAKNPLDNSSNQNTLPSNSQTPRDINQKPSSIPDTIDNINSLGKSSISFVDSGNEIFIKHETNLVDARIEISNIKDRNLIKVYMPDVNSNPLEMNNIDPSKFRWIDILQDQIPDASGSSVLVSDTLFSFKKQANSNNFLFVIDWERNTTQNRETWTAYQSERVLYYYDRNQNPAKLNKISSFRLEDSKQYSYPKIDTFSQDGQYVSVLLYGCWGCGGHKPQTLLVDLKTLITKNIGKVEQFNWGQNGAYEYKDYVVSECPQSTDGVEKECIQNPSTLPLKTGQL